MSKRFKDFGKGGQVDKRPLSFSLYGEEFHCHPTIQGHALLSIVANSNLEDGASVARGMDKFFNTCLISESLERFNALLSDPEKIVSVETLGEITAWLMEEYSNRPTQQPDPSSSGQ